MNFFNSQGMGKLRECWAGDACRGSQCLSRAYFWATVWSTSETDWMDTTSKAVLATLHGNSKREEHVFNVVGREGGRDPAC